MTPDNLPPLPPVEESLRRAYYYTEAGEWRGPEVDEWDRWHAVAKVAAQAVAQERERMNQHAVTLAETARLVEQERCARLCDEIHARHIAEYGDYFVESYATQCAEAIRKEPTP